MDTHTDDRSTSGATRWLALGAFLLVAFATGFVGNLLQGDDVASRYLSFERPPWAPPQEAFGIVWPVLYGMIGFAAWKIWDVAGGLRHARVALGLWGVQLVINAVWPGIFFGLTEFGWAIPVILALIVTVAATMRAFYRHDAVAAGLLGPYLLWITYAAALNVALWVLNR